ncbi:MAG: hypothetical protein ABIC96_02230 [Patescibacteria group bacterium]
MIRTPEAKQIRLSDLPAEVPEVILKEKGDDVVGSNYKGRHPFVNYGDGCTLAEFREDLAEVLEARSKHRWLQREFVRGQDGRVTPKRDRHIKGGRCHYASEREYHRFTPRRVLLTTNKGSFRIDPYEECSVDPSTLIFDFDANLRGMNDVGWDSLKELNANLPQPTLGLIMPPI